jgi:hypothetical protein
LRASARLGISAIDFGFFDEIDRYQSSWSVICRDQNTLKTKKKPISVFPVGEDDQAHQSPGSWGYGEIPE